MDWINSIIQQYNVMTKANPMVATLVVPILAGILFYLKNIPSKIWDGIVRTTTVTLCLNNAGFDGNIDAYTAFDRWFMQSGYKKFSRNFFMFRKYGRHERDSVDPYRMGIGNGMHFFFYGKRFFWFRKGNLESGGSERQKEEIKIYTFGWNSTVFEKLIELFNKQKEDDGKITVHSYSASDRGWNEVGEIVGRNIDTFCMNKELKDDILKKISSFINGREWYRKKGLTYKTSFLFEGPPGTGKTTLSKLLAAHFSRDIYILDLNEMSNVSLWNALSMIKPGSILLMEDIDEAGKAVRNRDTQGEQTFADMMSESRLTMSGLLNAFDGVVGLDDIIIIMTTNHPEKLDAAVKRKGRVDNEIHIGELTIVEIEQYLYHMFDDINEEHSLRLKKMIPQASGIVLPGCEVENAYKENSDNPIAFLADVHSRHLARIPLEEVA